VEFAKNGPVRHHFLGSPTKRDHVATYPKFVQAFRPILEAGRPLLKIAVVVMGVAYLALRTRQAPWMAVTSRTSPAMTWIVYAAIRIQ